MCDLNEKCSCNNVETADKTVSDISTVEDGKIFVEESTTETHPKQTEYFDQALKLTEFGKFNYVVILVSGLILTTVLLETLGISFVLPVSHCDMNFSMEERGALSAIGFAGIITSSHLWGFLADTTGRRNIIRPTLLLAFIVSVISSFSTNFWMLVILRFINGFCISGGSATIYVYLGEFHTSKNRSRAIMGAAFIFGVGATLMPAIAWLVINQEWKFYVPLIDIYYKPWRFFMVVCGLPGLICGLSLFKIPESPKFLLSQGNEEKALEVLRTIYKINTGKPREEYKVDHVVEDLDFSAKPLKLQAKKTGNPISTILHAMWHQTQPIFNRQYLRITALICCIQFWIYVSSNGMYMWFPHILNTVSEFLKENPGNRSYICDMVYSSHAKAAAAAAVEELTSNGMDNITNSVECNEKLEIKTFQDTLLLEVLYAIGFAFIGFIINKVGKMYILFVILAVCGVCGILTVFVDIPMVAIYLYVVFLLCGLGANVLSASTVDLYPTKLRAMSVCISLMAGRLGSVVGSVVTGALLTNYCTTAFITFGSTLILGGLLGFLIPKPKVVVKRPSSRRSSLISMTGN